MRSRLKTGLISIVLINKKKELDIKAVAEMGIDISPRMELLSVELPPTRQEGIKVESVEELVSKLTNEAKVIS